MVIRGFRFEFFVGVFLLLVLVLLMVLVVVLINQCWSWGSQGYELKVCFFQVGQLCKQVLVKIGGVIVGQVVFIDLDLVKFEFIVILCMDSKVKDLLVDILVGIFISGLFGESYIGLQLGGDLDVLKVGDEIVFIQLVVDLIQLVGKYMFSGGVGGGVVQKFNDGVQVFVMEL